MSLNENICFLVAHFSKFWWDYEERLWNQRLLWSSWGRVIKVFLKLWEIKEKKRNETSLSKFVKIADFILLRLEIFYIVNRFHLTGCKFTDLALFDRYTLGLIQKLNQCYLLVRIVIIDSRRCFSVLHCFCIKYITL